MKTLVRYDKPPPNGLPQELITYLDTTGNVSEEDLKTLKSGQRLFQPIRSLDSVDPCLWFITHNLCGTKRSEGLKGNRPAADRSEPATVGDRTDGGQCHGPGGL